MTDTADTVDTADAVSPAEARLIAELSNIDHQIGDLLKEKEAIQRVLIRIRQQKVKKTDVTRKNSFNRILIESRVVEILKYAKRPISTMQLYSAAKDVIYTLKENTFRSCLHRMKKSGLIVSKGRGDWAIPMPKG
jgi:hypothetical protein